jgi:molecular chaperone GrpE
MSEKDIKNEEDIEENRMAEEKAETDIEFVSEEGEDLKNTDPIQKIKELKEKLKVCQKERQEYLNSWQRERADFQNFKKDETERMVRAIDYAREQMILNLLPALDSYDMAFANKEAWEKVDKNWRIGVEYIHQQILKVLSDYGVMEIETKEGNIFDPNLHQSIELIETNEKEKDHTIAAITQTGYKIGEKVLRPARVNVFEYKK